MPASLNDTHSQLNATLVAEVCRPETLGELREIIREAAADGMRVSVAGGRHAMGGQQFAGGSLHIDMTALDNVMSVDGERGLLHIEAGACWPRIIAESHRIGCSPGKTWAIRQKQTGVDDVTLGGSISANAHGRGLMMQPIGDDIEDLTLLDAEGRMLRCSQSENAELFSLVIGGTAAAVKLLGGLGADIIAVSFLIELSFLGGRDKLPEDKVRTILGY